MKCEVADQRTAFFTKTSAATDMKDAIIEVLNEVLRENGHAPFPFTATTNIFRETAIDSLALAVVLVKLEERVGKDPFAEGFTSFSTVGELVRIYENA